MQRAKTTLPLATLHRRGQAKETLEAIRGGRIAATTGAVTKAMPRNSSAGAAATISAVVVVAAGVAAAAATAATTSQRTTGGDVVLTVTRTISMWMLQWPIRQSRGRSLAAPFTSVRVRSPGVRHGIYAVSLCFPVRYSIVSHFFLPILTNPLFLSSSLF
jgi:hypothetical protein